MCSVSRLCQCGVLSHSNSIVTLRALPTLVRLCKARGDVPVNTQAAHTLGKYVHCSMSSNAHSSYSQGVLDVLLVSVSSYLLAKSTKSYALHSLLNIHHGYFGGPSFPRPMYFCTTTMWRWQYIIFWGNVQHRCRVNQDQRWKLYHVCLLHLPLRLANYTPYVLIWERGMSTNHCWHTLYT